VFDDSTVNDATTSWVESELIGTVSDSDQHDRRTTSRRGRRRDRDQGRASQEGAQRAGKRLDAGV
jgi:hypothetical protein